MKRQLIPLTPALLLMALSFFTLPAMAINCQRAASPVENTLCNNSELLWLDENLNWLYQTEIVNSPKDIWASQQEWQRARNACVSDLCIQRAYMQGISWLVNVDKNQSIEGTWWNKTAPNGSGSTLTISHVSHWGFELSGNAWAGVNRVTASGEGRLYYGIGLVGSLKDAQNCKVLLMPHPNGTLEVSTNSEFSCQIFMPNGLALDGIYVRADSDPRPLATLLSLGILPGKDLDDKFRKLVGTDYENYVATANTYTYSDDLDGQGATVMTLSVKGMANKKAAMIRYTPDGKFWAMRIEPDVQGKVVIHYVTTEQDKAQLPKTLAAWRLNFSEAGL